MKSFLFWKEYPGNNLIFGLFTFEARQAEESGKVEIATDVFMTLQQPASSRFFLIRNSEQNKIKNEECQVDLVGERHLTSKNASLINGG